MTRQPGLYATFETSEGRLPAACFEKDAPKLSPLHRTCRRQAVSGASPQPEKKEQRPAL